MEILKIVNVVHSLVIALHIRFWQTPPPPPKKLQILQKENFREHNHHTYTSFLFKKYVRKSNLGMLFERKGVLCCRTHRMKT